MEDEKEKKVAEQVQVEQQQEPEQEAPVYDTVGGPAQDIAAVAEANGQALEYDISEVLSKLPGNKGYGYMNGKVSFITADDQVMGADQVIKTIEASRKITEAYYGGPEAKIAAEAVSRTAAGVTFDPNDVLAAWSKTAKADGLLAPDYTPGEDADVMDSKATAGAGSMLDRVLRTAVGQMEAGTGVVDATTYALAMFSDSDEFRGMGDAAKAYYAEKLVGSTFNAHHLMENRAVTHMADSWNKVEADASKTIASQTAMLPPSFVIPLSPEDKSKARMTALDLNNKALQSSGQATQAEKDLVQERDALKKMESAYHARGKEAGYETALSELAAQRSKIKQVEDVVKSGRGNADEFRSLANQQIEWATKGMPYEMRESEIRAMSFGAESLQDPVALSQALEASGAGKYDFTTLNPRDQYAFYLNHSINGWYADQVKADPAKQEVWATIRARALDQFNKTGNVASIAPELDAVITQQVEQGKIAALEHKKSTAAAEKTVESLLKDAKTTTNNLMSPTVAQDVDTIGELTQEMNGLVSVVNQTALPDADKQAFARDVNTLLEEAKRSVVGFDAVRGHGGVVTGPSLVQDRTGFNVLAMANELEGQTLRLDQLPEVFRLLAGPDYKPKEGSTKSTQMKSIKEGTAKTEPVPFANKVRTMNVAFDAVQRGLIEGGGFKDEVFIKGVKEVTGMYRAVLNKMPDDPRYFEEHAAEYQSRINQLREARKVLNPAGYERFERAKKAEILAMQLSSSDMMNPFGYGPPRGMSPAKMEGAVQ